MWDCNLISIALNRRREYATEKTMDVGLALERLIAESTNNRIVRDAHFAVPNGSGKQFALVQRIK
jgi:hypothetical protein